MSFRDNVVTVTVHLFAYEALQPCGRHYCYYRGTCINSSCSCLLHTFGVYCEYTTGEPYTTVKFQCKHHHNLYDPLEHHTTCTKSKHLGFGLGLRVWVATCNFCPVTAPSGQLTVSLTGHVTSATLNWSVPVDYESIARYGGVWYTVHTQNMDTGWEETLTCSSTTITHSLVHSTEYCFRVRAEVSGGAGVYSERQCYTTPGMTVVNECNTQVLNITGV